MKTADYVGATAMETFDKNRGLFHTITRSFISRYGGEWEEVEAEVNFAFVQAYRTWRPEFGPLSKRLGYVIWKRLLGERKRRLAANRINSLNFEPEQPRRFDLRRVLREVGEEAGVVLRLLFDPADMAIRRGGIPKSNKPSWRAYRRGLLRVLGEAGWTAAEVCRAFNEIRGAL